MPTQRHFANSDHAELVDVAKGLVIGTEVRNIFGYQVSGDTTLRACWEFANTSYVYPADQIVMTVVSADAADNGKVLLIKGLDRNYNQIQETVVINGGGNIPTTKEYFRINDLVLLTGVTNAGLISVQDAGLSINYAGIRPGDTRNQASIFTVPKDYDFFLFRLDAFSSDTTAAKSAIFRNFSQTKAGQQFNTARTTFLGNMNIQRRLPFRYEECTDIQFQLATRQGAHELSVFGEGVLYRR